MTDTKHGTEGRKDLFDWLTRQLSGLSDFSDAIHLLKPACSAMTVFYLIKFRKVYSVISWLKRFLIITCANFSFLFCYFPSKLYAWLDLSQDKSSDVRKAADTCINEILRVSGQEIVSLLGKFQCFF